MVADNIDVMSARAECGYHWKLQKHSDRSATKQICRTLNVLSHTFLFIPRGPRGKKKSSLELKLKSDFFQMFS